MEDAHKKALQASLPFSDNLLVAFSTHSLLYTNYFPKDRLEWDGKTAAEKTWKE